MNNVAEDIKDILLGESSLELTFGTDLFVGREPAEPNDCVTIFDTSGQPPQLTLEEEGATLNYDSFQIRVRNTSYRDGWDVIESIQDLLHGRANETWNGTMYSVIFCSSGPALLEWDENDRVKFIINYRTIRR